MVSGQVKYQTVSLSASLYETVTISNFKITLDQVTSHDGQWASLLYSPLFFTVCPFTCYCCMPLTSAFLFLTVCALSSLTLYFAAGISGSRSACFLFVVTGVTHFLSVSCYIYVIFLLFLFVHVFSLYLTGPL